MIHVNHEHSEIKNIMFISQSTVCTKDLLQEFENKYIYLCCTSDFLALKVFIGKEQYLHCIYRVQYTLFCYLQTYIVNTASS